jgi:hypothetical protein
VTQLFMKYMARENNFEIELFSLSGMWMYSLWAVKLNLRAGYMYHSDNSEYCWLGIFWSIYSWILESFTIFMTSSSLPFNLIPDFQQIWIHQGFSNGNRMNLLAICRNMWSFKRIEGKYSVEEIIFFQNDSLLWWSKIIFCCSQVSTSY